MTTRLSWPAIIDEAKRIVESYDTPVTLRQLYYRLVAAQLIPNQPNYYRRLSAYTAQYRRDGTFPELSDESSEILQRYGYRSPGEALRGVAYRYRRNRTEGQTRSICLAVEKRGMVNQLQSWFGELNLPILALGGYASQSYCGRIARDVARQHRPAVLLYAGDHDASGIDIFRDLLKRTDCWFDVRHIALTPAQVEEYELPESVGKEDDPRKTGFMEMFGTNVQVELDALPPDTVQYLYHSALDEFWDDDAYQDVLARETDERDRLIALADEWEDE